jgi:hypothetical protein
VIVLRNSDDFFAKVLLFFINRVLFSSIRLFLSVEDNF